MRGKDGLKPYKNKASAPNLANKPKRGKLSKLMTEKEKQNAGIHELSYDFGCSTNYGSRFMVNGEGFLIIIVHRDTLTDNRKFDDEGENKGAIISQYVR